MASEDSASLGIDKFNGENFHLWKFKMQMVLEEKVVYNMGVLGQLPQYVLFCFSCFSTMHTFL